MAGSLERSYSSQPVFALPSLYIFKDSEHKKDPFKISSLVGTARGTINGAYGWNWSKGSDSSLYFITNWLWKWKSFSRVRLFVTPWTMQSMEFSRPEYWSGQPFPSPGDLPNPRDQTQVSHIAGGFFTNWAIGCGVLKRSLGSLWILLFSFINCNDLFQLH